jgi:hypothetical protein
LVPVAVAELRLLVVLAVPHGLELPQVDKMGHYFKVETVGLGKRLQAVAVAVATMAVAAVVMMDVVREATAAAAAAAVQALCQVVVVAPRGQTPEMVPLLFIYRPQIQ